MNNFANKILRGVGAAALVLLLMAAGPGLYTGSVSIPLTGTFTTSTGIRAASGAAMTINNLGNQGIYAHYGDGSNNGLSMFDGGTVNYSYLNASGLQFSGSSSIYGTGGQYVQGNGQWTGGGLFGSDLRAPNFDTTTSSGIIYLGVTGVDNTSGGVYIGTGAGTFSQISVNSGATLGVVTCSLFGFALIGSGYKMCMDSTGDMQLSGGLSVGLDFIDDSGGNRFATFSGISTQLYAPQGTGTTGEIDFGNQTSPTEFGHVSNSGYTNPSALRLKYAVKPFQQDALKLIENTYTSEFCYKVPGKVQPPCTTPNYGIIADYSPWPIATKKHDGFQSTQATAVLIRAVQEQQAEIKALEAEVKALHK